MNRRNATIPTFLLFLTLSLLLLAVTACGGDDDDDGVGEATVTSAATTAGSGPGTVTLTSTAIEGQADKILLVFATSGGQQVGRVCAQSPRTNSLCPRR